MNPANATDVQFRITMAAIDPSEPAELEDTPNGTTRPRATLKIIRQTGDFEDDDSEDDSEDEEYMRALLAESDSDDEDEEAEDEANGGPSDPSKSKKARKQAALAQLMESIKSNDDSDQEMEDATEGTNGVKADKKGKAKASSDDEEEDSSDDDDDDEGIEVEEFVLCTLDPEKVRPVKLFQLTHTNTLSRTTSNPWTSPSARTSVSSSLLPVLTRSTLLVTT